MRKGSTPICHYGSPLTLYSQIAPSTGRREHLLKSFIDYAFFSGFLGPPSQIAIATRIAHHTDIVTYFIYFCKFDTLILFYISQIPQKSNPIQMPTITPTITSIGECPNSSTSFSWTFIFLPSLSIILFKTAACFPAALLTPVASYITIKQNTDAKANVADPNPSVTPIAVANEVIQAVLD